MGIIKRMPQALADQIAAGEVVERPASVVKELVENAIDAGADTIAVEIQQGGQKLIQITDNGTGMAADDLELAFARHASSKIHSSDELFSIATLGFRGEALPSIASVARVKASSSPDGKEAGEIIIEGGSLKGIKPAPPRKGTIVQVRNLFYNTPARRKFLKRPATESQHIVETIRKFALCYPRVAFTLASDSKEVFRLAPTDLQTRIGEVFGRHYANALKDVTLDKPPYRINGFTGSLSLVRGRPKEQYIFLNGRTVQDRLLNSAVYGAYRSLISRGEYPFFVLHISMPLDEVDVNVHPAKSEVRFKDEWRVFHVLKTAVTEAIKDIPGMMPDFGSPGQWQGSAGAAAPPSGIPGDIMHGAPLFDSATPTRATPDNDDSAPHDGKSAADRFSAGGPAPTRPDTPFNPESIWQVHNKYILSQVASGLVMIDQHVAHERVLFEDALRALNDNPLPSQTLLFPQVVEFAPDEFSHLLNLLPYLERLGFRIREFGKNTVVVEGMPMDVTWGREREIITDILDRVEQRRRGAEVFDQMAASFACKAAVKAGDALTSEEMRTLVDRLFATENPYYCPHGRPTIVHLSMEEMDRRFERI